MTPTSTYLIQNNTALLKIIYLQVFLNHNFTWQFYSYFQILPSLIALSMATCVCRRLINGFMKKQNFVKIKIAWSYDLSRSNEAKSNKMSFTAFILVSLRNLSVSEYGIAYKLLKVINYSRKFYWNFTKENINWLSEGQRINKMFMWGENFSEK